MGRLEKEKRLNRNFLVCMKKEELQKKNSSDRLGKSRILNYKVFLKQFYFKTQTETWVLHYGNYDVTALLEI